MGGEHLSLPGTTVVDAPENVSPTGAQIDESDMEDTLTSAKENYDYADVRVMPMFGRVS
jgi:hypothetical protein